MDKKDRHLKGFVDGVVAEFSYCFSGKNRAILWVISLNLCYVKMVNKYVIANTSNNFEKFQWNIWYESRHEKTCLREFATRSDSNWPAQLQKLALGLKFWLQKLETLSHTASQPFNPTHPHHPTPTHPHHSKLISPTYTHHPIPNHLHHSTPTHSPTTWHHSHPHLPVCPTPTTTLSHLLPLLNPTHCHHPIPTTSTSLPHPLFLTHPTTPQSTSRTI